MLRRKSTGQTWAAANMETDDDAARLCDDYPDAAVYVRTLRLSVREQIRWLEQAARAAKQIGGRQGEGNHLGSIGIRYYELGEVQRAIEYHEQYLAIAREIGDRRGEGNALANMGNACKKLGDMDKAKELWRAALAIYEAIEDPNAERVRGWLRALERERR